ncbi:MAG: riboflavin kinase [Parcubacteria group bacterium]|jgi:riboflavin kinase/FMN adenylyltransferase
MNIFEGKVLHGKKEGQTIGYPTANVEYEGNMEDGIYAGFALVGGKKYKTAILNRCGTGILEAYLLDFSGDLYGKKVELEVGKRMRELFDESDKDKWIKDIEETVEKIKKLE